LQGLNVLFELAHSGLDTGCGLIRGRSN
jgi:hypothetical protein